MFSKVVIVVSCNSSAHRFTYRKSMVAQVMEIVIVMTSEARCEVVQIAAQGCDAAIKQCSRVMRAVGQVKLRCTSHSEVIEMPDEQE